VAGTTDLAVEYTCRMPPRRELPCLDGTNSNLACRRQYQYNDHWDTVRTCTVSH
jgi:hypothetical protein